MGFFPAGYNHNENIINAKRVKDYNLKKKKHQKETPAHLTYIAQYFPISITKQRLILGVRSNKQYANYTHLQF